MMRVTDVNIFRASTSSASQTTIIALNILDPPINRSTAPRCARVIRLRISGPSFLSTSTSDVLFQMGCVMRIRTSTQLKSVNLRLRSMNGL